MPADSYIRGYSHLPGFNYHDNIRRAIEAEIRDRGDDRTHRPIAPLLAFPTGPITLVNKPPYYPPSLLERKAITPRFSCCLELQRKRNSPIHHLRLPNECPKTPHIKQNNTPSSSNTQCASSPLRE
jgi:hypothetical protein